MLRDLGSFDDLEKQDICETCVGNCDRVCRFCILNDYSEYKEGFGDYDD